MTAPASAGERLPPNAGGRPVRVGLVGFGAIAELGHVPALRALGARAEIVAVVDAEPARRAAARELLALAPSAVHPSVDDLVDSAVPADLVVVALPATAGVDAVRRVAAAGYRVLAEKPLAADARTAGELAADPALANRIGVVHNYLHRSDVTAARSALDDQDLRPVRLLRLEQLDAGHFPGRGRQPDWRRDRRLSGGGCLLDNAYHWIYVAEALVGEPIKAVTARLGEADSSGVEDIAVLAFEHAGGALTLAVTAWCAPGAERVLEVHAAGGSLRMSGDGGRCEVNRGQGWRSAGEATGRSGYELMYRAVVDGVHRGERIGATPAEAVRVLRVVDAAYASARLGRTLDIDLKEGT